MKDEESGSLEEVKPRREKYRYNRILFFFSIFAIVQKGDAYQYRVINKLALIKYTSNALFLKFSIIIIDLGKE